MLKRWLGDTPLDFEKSGSVQREVFVLLGAVVVTLLVALCMRMN